MKSKSLILLAVSMGFGLVAAIGISQSMGRGPKTVEKKVATTKVVVAKKDIEIKEQLTEENCEIIEIEEAYKMEGTITDLDEIKAKFANSRILAKMQIPQRYVSDVSAFKTNGIPQGYKLSFVNLKASDGFSNIIKPGNLVDVIGIFGNRNSREAQPTAKTFLKRIKVFSVNGNSRAVYDEEDDGNTRRDAVIGLLVTEKQSEKLQLVSDQASIKLTLLGDEDVDETFANKPDTGESSGEGMSMDHVYGLAKQNAGQSKQGFSNFLAGLGDVINQQTETARTAGFSGFKPHSMIVYTNEGPITYRWEEPDSLPQRIEGFSPVRSTAPRPVMPASTTSRNETKSKNLIDEKEFDANEFGKEFGSEFGKESAGEVEPTPLQTGE
jgi:Flp pilus assembly protein CpaB